MTIFSMKCVLDQNPACQRLNKCTCHRKNCYMIIARVNGLACKFDKFCSSQDRSILSSNSFVAFLIASVALGKDVSPQFISSLHD